jgi:DNA gyrase subunit B
VKTVDDASVRQVVRARPETYVGNLEDGTALENMLCIVLNEFVHGVNGLRPRQIKISVRADRSFLVESDVSEMFIIRSSGGRATIDPGLTALHVRDAMLEPRFGTTDGIAVPNILADYLLLEAGSPEGTYVQDYRCGEPLGPLQLTGLPYGGSRITLFPDKTVFGEARLHVPRLVQRIKADLTAADRLTIAIKDEATGQVVTLASGQK